MKRTTRKAWHFATATVPLRDGRFSVTWRVQWSEKLSTAEGEVSWDSGIVEELLFDEPKPAVEAEVALAAVLKTFQGAGSDPSDREHVLEWYRAATNVDPSPSVR
jgi:hypothetical protein